MAELQKMPAVKVPVAELKVWGQRWLSDKNDATDKAKKKRAFDKQQSVNFASFIDLAFANSIAAMLGDIKVVAPKGDSLLPPHFDCVEIGHARIIGGIRPQNYDVAYRPDGPRIVFDSKTLNDTKSVGKNWQNMVNDLATEATTVHTRFPYAIVAFMVVVPAPALQKKQERDLIRTLERMATRRSVIDLPHLAEAISLIVWDPEKGELVEIPDKKNPLHVSHIHEQIEPIYYDRYKGLPPHGGE